MASTLQASSSAQCLQHASAARGDLEAWGSPSLREPERRLIVSGVQHSQPWRSTLQAWSAVHMSQQSSTLAGASCDRSPRLWYWRLAAAASQHSQPSASCLQALPASTQGLQQSSPAWGWGLHSTGARSISTIMGNSEASGTTAATRRGELLAVTPLQMQVARWTRWWMTVPLRPSLPSAQVAPCDLEAVG